MAKKSGRRRHVPQRTCVACNTVRPKRELVRIVRVPEGGVFVDETGKLNGRGAYLCRQRVCWETALARKRLEQALHVTLTNADLERLHSYLEMFPATLAAAPGTPELSPG
jgi:predicted RNA-binding protein YlxR (DUF448 family)